MGDALEQRRRAAGLAIVALFGSAGTLVCCALPIALVSLGLGAAMASLASQAPWLVALSSHKAWVFAGSAVLLVLAGWLIYRQGRQCPADPELARWCARLDRWNRRVHALSVVIWLVGFVAAYLALPLRQLAGE